VVVVVVVEEEEDQEMRETSFLTKACPRARLDPILASLHMTRIS
jgi:hypothetical protein